MSIRDDIPALLKHIDQNRAFLDHNEILFNIYEGDLQRYIEKDLREQFTKTSFEQIRHRLCPINVLRRIIDKLSQIYSKGPVRTIEDGTEGDKALLDWYEKELKINQKLNIYNEFFNLHKGALLEPYINRQSKPAIRIIPYDRFLPYSADEVDPNSPTHMIVFAGTMQKQNSKSGGGETNVYKAYTDDEFVIFDSDGDVVTSKMAASGSEAGVNIYKKIPFVYVNRSHNLLVPLADTDTLKLTKIIPILLSDLNYAVMFQAFSIIYGIDIDDQSLTLSPNSFWRLKSEPGSEKQPQLGVIKPQVDIDQVLSLIQAEFSFWLNTMGIRPGSIGQLTTDNFASGISKMIDEMDITESRNKQVEYFTDAEEELWSLIFNHMHPVWAAAGVVDERSMLSAGAEVIVHFPEQLPMVNRGELVKTLHEEVAAGFTTRRQAIRKLNPEFTDAQLDEHLAEIEAERYQTAETATPEEENSSEDEREDGREMAAN